MPLYDPELHPDYDHDEPLETNPERHRPALPDHPFGACDVCDRGSSYDFEEAVNLYRRNGEWLCEDCANEVDRYDEDCANEVDRYEDEDYRPPTMDEHEHMTAITHDHQPPPPLLLLPVMEQRSARLISCEQEVGSGADDIARMLYEAGATTRSELLPYHSGDNSGFCRVEEDGSVDAEIIYPMLRLDTQTVARRLEDTLMLVRSAIADDLASLDMRCGFHVHVDVKGFGMRHVENLYHLWNHLEDPIFRLSAAYWRKHRTEVAEHNYALCPPKRMRGGREVGYYFENARGALNLAPYLASRGSCRCGAFSFAEWESCTCPLPKSTAEFRVFNATANLRKIHAYTALSLALVEYAHRNEVGPEEHPPRAWRGTHDFDYDAAEAGWGFITGRLPLTTAEVASLEYTARASSLAPIFTDTPGEEID